jgi:hypothetical protein
VCALFGVLTIAMPVPIIVANFKHFYEQETRLATLRQTYDVRVVDDDEEVYGDNDKDNLGQKQKDSHNSQSDARLTTCDT